MLEDDLCHAIAAISTLLAPKQADELIWFPGPDPTGHTRRYNKKSEHEMMGRWGRILRNVGVAVAAVACVGLLATGTASAQKKKAAKKSKPQVAWVKLCQEKVVMQVPKGAKGKKVKPTRVKKMLCHTRFEQLAPFAAMSIQVQQIANVKEMGLVISYSMPHQMAIKPGILAAVYSASQWAQVQKKKAIDKKNLKILKVGYTRCGPGSCNAEVPAPQPLIDDMRKGSVMLVKAFRGDGQVVEVPVSLAGFAKVMDGKPTNLAKYQKARAAALRQLTARRNDILAKERARRAGAKIPEPRAIVKQ